MNMVNPLAKHVPVVNIKLKGQHLFAIHAVLGNTMINKENLVVHPVVLENTMINKDKQVANHVVLENTTINKNKLQNQLLVKIAMWENTKTKREKHPARMIV